ncbi:unnamed protein product [Effrenium voratum]|uniref:Mitochondrial processing peptidase n=1 Tax=Effrenium voratum TaxID=2562239 RepID=A0AA36JJK8_9DINO|nr:unnamed protein product [Effrenium voratum]CAJ1406224.1 unnamed protein product [Effrenium voratum]CAJ1438229.1 unnamed protein product [Effrenium voratum]|mmetsp:Transcript_74712/g.178245  ORF Transcript_74712/g.178245 Transcript_74712/m.178245 type:complete len:471 (+) Transcript_74712:60-1472(+)
MFRLPVGRHAIRSLYGRARRMSSLQGELAAYQQPPTKVTRLASGMRVASQYTPDETVTVGVWIDAGSRFETKENNGTAHFLEHMAFKGTKRRSRIQLEQEIENMGGHLNAYTSREQTVYYAKCFGSDLRNGVDILADILQHSTLDPGPLDFERGVILREMEEVEKTTEEVLLDRLHLTAFHGSPLGFTILGPVENIQSITREHLREYVETNYLADRIVVAAAGPVDHGELVQHSEELFCHFRPGTGKRKEETPSFYGAELLYRSEEENSLAHFAVGFEGVSWTHPDSLTFMVIQSIVGNYKRNEGLVPAKLSSNRITNSIASNLGPGAESFSAFNTSYKDTGLFGFYGESDEDTLDGYLDELLFAVSNLAFSVTEEEVERGKRQLKTTLFGSLDSTTAIAEDIARQLLVYGRRIPLAELLLRLDAINIEDVKRVAREHLFDKDVAVTALGPLSRMPALAELRRRTAARRF